MCTTLVCVGDTHLVCVGARIKAVIDCFGKADSRHEIADPIADDSFGILFRIAEVYLGKVDRDLVIANKPGNFFNKVDFPLEIDAERRYGYLNGVVVDLTTGNTDRFKEVTHFLSGQFDTEEIGRT